MLFDFCFGNKVYIDKDLVGHISSNGDMFADGYKFGSLTEFGEIYIHDEYVGFINEDNNIIVKGYPGGHVSSNGDLIFDSLDDIVNKEEY